MRTLVLVDDDELTHLLLARALRGSDWAVTGFEVATDAIAHLLANGMPDLLIVDQRMPLMDGHELLSELGLELDLGAAAVFLSSAHAPPSDVCRTVEALGARIAPKELTRTVEGLDELLRMSERDQALDHDSRPISS